MRFTTTAKSRKTSCPTRGTDGGLQKPFERSPGSVYELVSTPAGFTKWWAEDVVEKQDGSIELGFFNRSTVYRFRAVALRRDELASWRCETGNEWQGTTLEFVLKPDGSGVVLRFGHRGWQAETDYFAMCNTTLG